MAYVPGFSYDVFVSFASEDLDERMAKLIDDLRRYLKRELGKLFADDSIFFDRRSLNQRPVNWPDALKEAARSTAILLPFLSPCYATSSWCADELRSFSSSGHPLEWKSQDQSLYRILPVLWRNLDTVTFGQLDPCLRAAQQDRTFSVEVLGAKLVEALKLMRRSFPPVYLGESKAEARVKVLNELSRAGYRVLPESPQAFDTEATVREHIADAVLDVHFIGGGTEQRTRNAIKWSRQKCGGATIVYLLPEVDPTAEELQELDWIEEDLRESGNAERYDRVDRKNLDYLLQAIRDRLDGPGIKPVTNLGIAFEESDRHTVESVASEIENATPFVIHRHGLGLADIRKSRSVLFYWGEGEGRRLRTAITYSAGRKAFLLAPPPRPTKNQPDLTGVDIFRQRSDRFHVDDIRPFLEELGWKG